MTTTEWPSAAITRSVRKSACASCGVNTAVGSSRISTREPLLTAFMISTRCCSPTESCQIFAPGSTGMWSASAVSSTCRCGLPSTKQERRLPVGERDVLGDRERLDQTEVLVHHPDARLDRVARRVKLDRPAAYLDLPLVGPVEAREDVHQRRLAGPVLPEERVHLAARDLERDVVVRDDAGEALRDAAHGNGRLSVGRPSPCPRLR